jgi:hypothetical protein
MYNVFMYEQFSVKFLINYNCKKLYLALEDEGYTNVLNKVRSCT